MTWLSALTAACALTAWALVRGWWTSARWPFHRPAAWLLTIGLATDVARWALRPLYAGAPRPFVWPERLAFHAEQALLIAWPLAILAAAVIVFLRRSPWPVAALWCACVAGLAIGYPELRDARLGSLYAVLWAICWAASVSGVIAWRARRLSQPVATHFAVWILIATEFSVVLAAFLRWHPDRDWIAARVCYAVGFGLVLAYQMWQIYRYRRRT